MYPRLAGFIFLTAAACNFSSVSQWNSDGGLPIVGDACGGCPAGESCQFGKCLCDPTLCQGCCATERCLIGTEANSCGKTGESCQSCDGQTDGPICAEQSCSCLIHAHCADSLNGPFCVNGKCGCAESANCPQGQTCTADGKCRATSCDSAHPCNGGCCADGACVSACEGGVACGANSLCPSMCGADATCVSGCCGAGGACSAGLEQTACGLAGACIDCSIAATGSVCRSGTCGCEGNSDCLSSGDGTVCNQATKSCGCLVAGDCPSGQACTQDGVCRPNGCDATHPCRDGCCEGGLCVGGGQTSACGNDGYACSACLGECGAAGQCTCVDVDDCPTPSNPCTPTKTCDDGICGAAHGNFAGTCGAAVGCAAAPLCNLGVCQPRTQIGGTCEGSTTCLANECDLIDGTCASSVRNEGETCNDNVSCTHSDICDGGECRGTEITCTGDADQCNFNICNGTSSCAANAKTNGTMCNDGSNDTYNDQCTGGTCAGTAVTCPADGQCFAYVKNGTATCTQVWNGATSCNDGIACTYNDSCNGGVTCSGTTRVCSGGDTCFDYVCNGTSTCGTQAKNDGYGCNDGNSCTYSDTCNGGSCTGTAYSCGGQGLCAYCDGNGSCAQSGCVDWGTGSCMGGYDDNSCGNNGNPCTQCYGGTYCSNGQCVCPEGPACAN